MILFYAVTTSIVAIFILFMSRYNTTSFEETLSNYIERNGTVVFHIKKVQDSINLYNVHIQDALPSGTEICRTCVNIPREALLGRLISSLIPLSSQSSTEFYQKYIKKYNSINDRLVYLVEQENELELQVTCLSEEYEPRFHFFIKSPNYTEPNTSTQLLDALKLIPFTGVMI